MKEKFKNIINRIKNMSTKKKIALGSGSAILTVVLVLLILKGIKVINTPVLKLIPPAPIQCENREEFKVDVMLTDLPKNLYPAASMVIGFDKNKLEFTGVKLGTMMTYGDGTIQGNSFNIPEWSYNVERANKIGQINTMYMDMTAGDYAYTNEGFDKEKKNLVIRLGFKLKDSASSGDIYNITVHDAVFATVNGDKNKTSLALTQDSLRVNGCKIVVKK